MPQITVDHPVSLTGAFDRTGFALALHAVVVDLANARIEACKTRFRPTEDNVVGGDGEGHDIVHVGLALLPGRSEETKARLTEAVLELVRAHVRPAPGRGLHVSAEVRELDASYRKSEE
ncbi:isomerase [Streptomyces minutiscleroticus]|uniref:Isomerase n=1 Tax=Streptomyces minutiscleroticus TaxID=68238 RepID=A0A918NAE2_9ACTN|nr:isomerase [Streptomyces minutiscleroticus]GGX52968.1 isomerase [Streptomyces minutiscleroticus]